MIFFGNRSSGRTFETYKNTIIEQDKEIANLKKELACVKSGKVDVDDLVTLLNQESVNTINDLISSKRQLEYIVNSMNDFLVRAMCDESLDYMYRQGYKDCYSKLTALRRGDD
jgi:hypothetical protein